MNLESLMPVLREQGPLLGTFLVGFLSGFIPIINAEIFIIGMVTTLQLQDMLWLIALMAAMGQIIAKVFLYFTAAGILKSSKGKRFNPKKLEKVSGKLMQGGWRGDLVMFSSALLGLPPIYLTSIVAGIARYSLSKLVILGMSGRFLRFYFMALFPDALSRLKEIF